LLGLELEKLIFKHSANGAEFTVFGGNADLEMAEADFGANKLSGMSVEFF